MQALGNAVVAAAAGTIAYSWVGDATEFTTLVASLVGIGTAAMGCWYYFERAMTERADRKKKEQKNAERDSKREPRRVPKRRGK